MNASNINPWAVLAAAVSTFVIGGLWYSPLLFGRAWMAANGFTPEQVARFSKPRAFGGSLLLALVMAANLAMFLADSKTDWRWGLTAGLLAGAGWVASAIAIIGLFENKSWTYILVNAGYQITAFCVMGLILGTWR
jgi:hypothetical protein